MNTTYFTEQEVHTLHKLEGLKLEHAIYHVWTNLANSKDVFQSLDWIELRFYENIAVYLTAGEESDGIKLVDFDLLEERKRVRETFGDMIEIRSYLMDHSEQWAPAIGHTVSSLELHEVRKGMFMNDELLLRFSSEEPHAVLISLAAEEGLLVELHEDLP